MSIPPRRPGRPARRSAPAKGKDAAKHTTGKLPVHKQQDLLTHLSTLSRQTITFSGHKIENSPPPPRSSAAGWVAPHAAGA